MTPRRTGSALAFVIAPIIMAVIAWTGCGTKVPLSQSTGTCTGSGTAKTGSGLAVAAADGCKGVTCTGDRVACDPADGKCKPDGTTTNVGETCSTSGKDPACGTDPSATCNNESEDQFPGGYCSVEPCSTITLCPIGSSCAGLGGESPACWKNCTSDADCRTPHYSCLDVTNLWVSGASKNVCYIAVVHCKSNADCPASQPVCSGLAQ